MLASTGIKTRIQKIHNVNSIPPFTVLSEESNGQICEVTLLKFSTLGNHVDNKTIMMGQISCPYLHNKKLLEIKKRHLEINLDGGNCRYCLKPADLAER